MKRATGVLAAAAAVLGLCLQQARAWEEGIIQGPDNNVNLVSNDKLHLDMFGRMQLLGSAENVPADVRNNDRVYLFLKQARLGFRGDVQGYKYEMQLEFGGEEQTSANSPVLTLLDMDADIPLKWDGAWVKAGQFRVPYGREELTDRGYIPFADRSIASLPFNFNRDVGVAIEDYKGTFAGTAGLFAGGGRDVNVNPTHNLPEQLGIPMMVGRVGYNDGVDEDIYHVVQTDLNIKRDEKAAFFNGMFMKDSTIGHSTVLNTEATTKPLLIDGGWNPYIGEEPNGPASLQDGDVYVLGGDAVWRHPLNGDQAVSGESQIDWGGYQNGFGRQHMASGRLQGSWLVKPFEIGLRYAAMMPDRKTAYAYTATVGGKSVNELAPLPGGDSVIHEVAPSLTWYIHGQNVKLVGDLPIYMNMPVFMEPGVGSYVMADLPDQISVLDGGTAKRYTVTEARLMLQLLF